MNPYENYKENSILTASPHQLTLMLYDGAIKNCNMALESLKLKDIPKTSDNLKKAQNIVFELIASLDLKYPIANELKTMYTYIYELLIDANIKKTEPPIIEAMGYLREFRNTWEEIKKKN